MNEYYIDDIRKFSNEEIKVLAKSPLEAVKKVYPQYNVTRDYSGKGDIVVGTYFETRYGQGYRTFVYNIEKRIKK